MLVKRKNGPVDYSKCNQKITVYHHSGTTYTSTVIDKAFFDFKKVVNIEKTGQKESTSFLLVIPVTSISGQAQPVYPEDKILLGEGQSITDADAWAAFIPSKVANLAVVKYVDAKSFNGSIVHWEAGG